jgi:cell division protein FtsL
MELAGFHVSQFTIIVVIPLQGILADILHVGNFLPLLLLAILILSCTTLHFQQMCRYHGLG